MPLDTDRRSPAGPPAPEPPGRTDPLADQLMQDLTGLRRVIRRRLRAELDLPALTGSQVELLRVVEESPGIGVAAAARTMHLAGNSVSSLVNQLIDAGYLRRETDPADRRAARLHLTRTAADRLAVWRPARARLVAGALAELSPAEREALDRALPAVRRLAGLLAEPPTQPDRPVPRPAGEARREVRG